MNSHETIEPGTSLWWSMLLITITIISLIIISGKKYPEIREGIRKISGWIMVAVAILLHVYLIYLGTWNLKTSLPLQLCSLSGILSGIVLLWRNQFAYELLLYWGIPGAIYSLLTPEMTQGSGGFFITEYYISHGGIIVSALYLSIIYEMHPRKNSWFKILLYTQILLFVVGVIDYFSEGNYMYLKSKPQVNNPFIIGGWPWYILFLELAGALHFYLVYLFFRSHNEKSGVKKMITTYRSVRR